MIEPVDALRLLRAHLCDGRPLPDDARAVLIAGIDQYLDDGGPLDRAFGLRQRGGVSVERSRDLAERDRMLRRVWRQVVEWRDQPPASAARMMVQSAQRYERTRWPREQESLDAPAAEPAATWWRILRSSVPVPAAKRLSQVLSEEIQSAL